MKLVNTLAAIVAGFALSGGALAAPTGTISTYASFAEVSNGYSDGTAQGLSVLFDLDRTTKLGLSVNNIDAWGDKARYYGVRYLTNLTDTIYVDTNVAFSDRGNITPHYRANGMLNFKVTEARNVILGVGLDHYAMRAGGEANTLTGQVVWYVPGMPLVLQGNASYVVSKVNDREGWRTGVAATYGRVGDWTVSARYSTGRAHYELASHPGSIADYKSETAGVSGQYWVTRDWGVSAGYGNVSNKYYKRDEVRIGAFYRF